MNWSEQLFNYCERGTDPAFWAEPLNALSNAAFVIAAGVVVWRLMRDEQAPRAFAALGLAALVALIGVGSFLFHTLATRLAQLGDIVPIGLFMLAYMAFALRRVLQLPRIGVALGLVGFVLACVVAAKIKCGSGPGPCLNGSLAYLPALLGLLGIGVLARRREQTRESGALLLVGGGIFALSLTLRTIDMSQCGQLQMFGHVMGTHFMWHLLNGFMLYLLLRAALEPDRFKWKQVMPKACKETGGFQLGRESDSKTRA